MLHNIKTAVVGAGFIGPVHVEALLRLGVTITGILGVDEKESNSAQQKLGLPKAYKNIDEVLADPAVTAVHLAVPNVLHYSLAKKCCWPARYVLCARNRWQCTPRSRLSWWNWRSRRRWRPRSVTTWRDHRSASWKPRDMVRRGDVGQIYHINGSYCQDWLYFDTDYNWRVLAEHGGELCAISDVGTHWMDLITSITGLHVEQVFADLQTVHPIPQTAEGRGADLHRQGAGADGDRRRSHQHRGLRRRPVPLQGRRQGQPSFVAGHRRTQERLRDEMPAPSVR